MLGLCHLLAFNKSNGPLNTLMKSTAHIAPLWEICRSCLGLMPQSGNAKVRDLAYKVS